MLVTDVSQLRAPPHGWNGSLFMDVETTSKDPRQKALDPHHGHRIAGVAMTFDDCQEAVYAPVRHRDARWNLPVDAVMRWASDWLRACGSWRNHNVKFDAHFFHYDGVAPASRMVDTVVTAKTLDTSRIDVGLSYELKELGLDWLGEKPDLRDEVRDWCAAAKTKDYGDVPADLLGRYACNDVLLNRKLDAWIESKIPDSMRRLYETEVALTSILFRMERRGLKTVPPVRLKQENFRSLTKMIIAADELRKMTGLEFVDSSDHAYEILVNQLGLPVLQWTEKDDGSRGGPSFDAEAMEKYRTLPQAIVDDRVRRVIDLMLEYRKERQFRSLFVESFQERVSPVDGLLHSWYNQVIRTGRMSCSDPNAQQMNKRAKGLIIPRRGAFLVIDASQIEFRIIVHYIGDAGAIEAYRTDPKTDFHRWVANLSQMDRDPAKNLNFACAYGAGKAKVTRMLAGNDKVIEAVCREVDASGVTDLRERRLMIERMTKERALQMYTTYHERLPGIKATSRLATDTARKRGYVFNAYGRRRNLPSTACHKAFNSLVQGCAMDFIKDRMVALEGLTQAAGVDMVANVHDELVFDGPPEVIEDVEFQSRLLACAEVQSVPFDVPFRWSLGHSRESWAVAKPK